MRNYSYKLLFFISILFILIIGSGMKTEPKNEGNFNINSDKDSLKTIHSYSINIFNQESVDLIIGDWDYCYSINSPNFIYGEIQRISTNDYNFSFDYLNFFKKNELIVPEELNLHNPKSNSSDLKSLMQFFFAKYDISRGYKRRSWWDFYVDKKENYWINDENPDNYSMKKDSDGLRLDDKMIGIFHYLMQSKITREIIYQSIKKNFILINNQISVFQKRLILSDIHPLIKFCENYSVNRKKYLNGRSSVTEKPGEDVDADYGYENQNQGFLFRRIEIDGVPPLELAQFLREFQKIIVNSINSSDYSSDMSCEINYGELKINSFTNSNNESGFLLRTNSCDNKYFIPRHSIRVTKLKISDKGYWRILYNQGKEFITLDENLRKI
jgi:hypothetical protein